MKGYLFVVAIIVFIPVSAWCAATVPPSANAPEARATVDDPRAWDFGIAKAGDVLEHEFALVNSAAKDLVIKDITTSCGCTVSDTGKKSLKPGESTTVSVRFDTKGYSGDSKQFVYVNTDNADDPIIRFTVRAHIVR